MSDIAKISGVELVHYIVILKVKHCYVRLLWIKKVDQMFIEIEDIFSEKYTVARAR